MHQGRSFHKCKRGNEPCRPPMQWRLDCLPAIDVVVDYSIARITESGHFKFYEKRPVHKCSIS